jgi:integrase
MYDLKKEIGDKIKDNRPKLSASSLKTYVSILSNIYKQMKGDGDVDWFSKNVKEILEYMDTKNDQTKKTSLSALYVLTKKDEYKEVMTTVLASVNATYKQQKKTSKQEENWISGDEVKKVYDDLLQKATAMLSKKVVFNDSKFIQFLLVAFLSGAVIPPRRSQDYGEMKIRNYDPKIDNYFKGDKFYFNVYKTAKTYGLQTLDVPKPLSALIKKWVKLNPTDYMLYSSNKQKLSSPQINRILNEAFGKAISTNMLRHIYLSDKYKNIPAIASIDALAEQMGHSSSQALEYIKR